MKRVVGTVVSLVGLVLVACQPPQPPSGYVQPVIDSVSVSPSTVVAGSTVQVTVRAHDDETIRAVQHDGFVLPQNTALPYDPSTCSAYTLVPDGPGAVVATATCTIPSYATNGTWRVRFTVLDTPSYWGMSGTGTFEVVGGTEDVTGPTTESVGYQPAATVAPDATVVVTARVSDPHGPIALVQGCCPPQLYAGPGVWFDCGTPTLVAVSPTAADATLVCTGKATNTPGVYSGSFTVSDALGNHTAVPVAVTVT